MGFTASIREPFLSLIDFQDQGCFRNGPSMVALWLADGYPALVSVTTPMKHSGITQAHHTRSS